MNANAGATERMIWARQAADPDWDAVFTEQLPRVFNYLRYRLGDKADVQELTSRTFEKAWRARRRYRKELAGFGTWLLRIAHNVAIDYLRVARDHAPLEAAAEATADGGPEVEQERASDMARLRSLMVDLPERERDLLSLKYGAGATNREIASVTGLSESNVGTILHRTVQVLRDRW
jgi:RNA polymerase sigma-70 factor (ECF subfamily)